MQFDSLRAFPYPVLRPDVDDYIDSDIQVAVDFQPTEDGQEVTCKVSYVLSVPEIEELVLKGIAKYTVVFACRDTYFRHTEQRDHGDFEVKFGKGVLRGEVQVYPYVIATAPVTGFEASSLNPEFGSGPFEFAVGSVLACDQPQAIYIDRDVFSPLTSIFVLAKSENLTGSEWRVNRFRRSGRDIGKRALEGENRRGAKQCQPQGCLAEQHLLLSSYALHSIS